MSTIATGYIVTSVVSVVMLVVAWRWPRAGRLLYGLLFLAAGVFNAVTAVRTPQVYVQGFAPHALPPMREFIERVVALVPDAFVLTMAAGQVLVAAALALGRGLLFWFGVVAATCFLVALSWLGVGAAFPTNLVMAAGVVLLLRARQPRRPR
jgi:Mn2+/Fe2+ NRAMP family transporter